MPKLIGSPPKYRRHKASGQAVVTLSGVDVYLGSHGTRTSKAEYDRVIAEWLAAGRQFPTQRAAAPLTIAELVVRYWRFAQLHFRKDGQPTRELDNIRSALRPVLALFGRTPAHSFGPLSLKAVRNRMIELGWTRGTINANVGRIKRVIKWAVSEELVPPDALHGLQSVSGLQEGRSDAREADPILPVSEAILEATIPYLPPVVRDMVRFQRFVGCRPGEVRALRPIDIDCSSDIWSYRPISHKMQHKGRERVIFIGPKAQEVLRHFLERPAESYCFQPLESEQQRNAVRRLRRKSKVQPSQHDRRKNCPRRRPGQCYGREDYARAIRRACDRAFPPKESLDRESLTLWRKTHRWSPNQLRHAAATEIRRRFGLEGAQVVLGHASADVSQIYAERDQSLAARIMAELG